MDLNKEAILVLIKERFRNNKTFFAETLGINRSYLNQILNGRKKTSSPKTVNRLIKYCKENDLDINDYIL